MSSNAGVNLSVYLPFPKAGVAFRIRVESDETPGISTFHLSVHRWVSDEDVPTSYALGPATDLSVDRMQCPSAVHVSPCLADWVRGYTRWLVRAGVTATNHNSIRIQRHLPRRDDG